jgi:hypothetical protein
MGVSIRQSFKHIDASDRSLIQQQLSIGRSYRSIAAALALPAWTISREVMRNGGDMGGYEAGAICNDYASGDWVQNGNPILCTQPVLYDDFKSIFSNYFNK